MPRLGSHSNPSIQIQFLSFQDKPLRLLLRLQRLVFHVIGEFGGGGPTVAQSFFGFMEEIPAKRMREGRFEEGLEMHLVDTVGLVGCILG